MSAFHPITIGTDVFNSAGNGRYVHSTVAIGGPTNEFKLIGGRYNSKQRNTVASLTRRVEFDITEGGIITRRPMVIAMQFTYPDGGTVANMDNLLTGINTWIDAATLNRLLLGAQ